MAIFANMKRIILITGGERSGKSVYAEQLALRLSEQPVYMATARIWTRSSANAYASTVNGEERNGPTSRKKNT